MPFYEITYETGRSSVAYYEDDAEALSATGEQHRRAVAGEAGGPLGVPAERVKKVRVYSEHPNDFNTEGTLTKEVATKTINELIKGMADENGVVAVDQLAVEVRALTHPMVRGTKEDSFDSNFLMKEDKELALPFAEEA